MSVLDRDADQAEDAVQMLQDIVVSEPQDVQAERFEELLTRIILIALRFVDWTVDFDHEVRVGAVEIDDEPVHRMLTPKIDAKLLAPERLPQPVFCLCRRMPHLSRPGPEFGPVNGPSVLQSRGVV